jgi:outer membrane protein TolC
VDESNVEVTLFFCPKFNQMTKSFYQIIRLTMKYIFRIIAFQFTCLTAFCQEGPMVQLTLNEAYSMAEANYPLIKQRELIAQTTAYSINNINKGYLPQLNINGQATYQSAVTEIPIKLPGAEIPTLSKDQYKLYGEVNQVVYDGGTLKHQKELQKAEANLEQQKLTTELYQLKDRINQLFFGALYIEEQLKQNDLVISDIQTGLNKMKAAVNNGTALRSQIDLLKADLLKTRQRTIELQANLAAYKDMLGLFTGREINAETKFVKPAQAILSKQINRPELLTYQAENMKLDVQDKMIRAKALPKLNLFFQGGLGRPALNMLSNDFDAYYIGGARLTWSISSLYTAKKDHALIGIKRNIIENRNETFLFNTTLSMKQSDAEIKKYNALLASDDEIITLRTKVKTAAIAQLDNGVITGNDYMREVIAEDQARQAKILHEIQLLMSQYNFQTTTGNQQ